MLYKLSERHPICQGDYYVAPGAQVIGSVSIGSDVSIWFNTVIRADNDWIHLGGGSNIQDNCVLHVDTGAPLHIGKRVTVGHNVVLHSCTIGDESLVGMNAVILNGAKIGRQCLIGANTLIAENSIIPEGSLVVGSPGKVKRQLTATERHMVASGASHYTDNSRRFRDHLEPCQPDLIDSQ